jgi:hypothetical protein
MAGSSQVCYGSGYNGICSGPSALARPRNLAMDVRDAGKPTNAWIYLGFPGRRALRSNRRLLKVPWMPLILQNPHYFPSDKNEYVRYSAILTLSKISSEGASAVGNTEILEHVPRLMDFHSSRSLTLETLGNLGFFQVLPSLGGALRARIKYFLRCLH